MTTHPIGVPEPAACLPSAMTPALTAPAGLRPKPWPVCLKRLTTGGFCLSADR